jgi:hypothetical protein
MVAVLKNKVLHKQRDSLQQDNGMHVLLPILADDKMAV